VHAGHLPALDPEPARLGPRAQLGTGSACVLGPGERGGGGVERPPVGGPEPACQVGRETRLHPDQRGRVQFLHREAPRGQGARLVPRRGEGGLVGREQEVADGPQVEVDLALVREPLVGGDRLAEQQVGGRVEAGQQQPLVPP
jgi:hypothetical protein